MTNEVPEMRQGMAVKRQVLWCLREQDGELGSVSRRRSSD
jgi:hypothetical protein